MLLHVHAVAEAQNALLRVSFTCTKRWVTADTKSSHVIHVRNQSPLREQTCKSRFGRYANQTEPGPVVLSCVSERAQKGFFRVNSLRFLSQSPSESLVAISARARGTTPSSVSFPPSHLGDRRESLVEAIAPTDISHTFTLGFAVFPRDVAKVSRFCSIVGRAPSPSILALRFILGLLSFAVRLVAVSIAKFS